MIQLCFCAGSYSNAIFTITGKSEIHFWHCAFVFFFDDHSTLHFSLQINQLIALTHSRDQENAQLAPAYIMIHLQTVLLHQ